MFLSIKLDDYVKLEEMIGNMGTLTMSEHISTLIHIIQQIIDRGVKDIYFEVLTDVQEIGEEGNLEKTYIIYDSRYHFEYHEYCLLLDDLFNKMFISCIDDISDDDMIQNIINHFLSNETIDFLNNIYDNFDTIN